MQILSTVDNAFERQKSQLRAWINNRNVVKVGLIAGFFE